MESCWASRHRLRLKRSPVGRSDGQSDLQFKCEATAGPANGTDGHGYGGNLRVMEEIKGMGFVGPTGSMG
jgi:hypothetical protein